MLLSIHISKLSSHLPHSSLPNTSITRKNWVEMFSSISSLNQYSSLKLLRRFFSEGKLLFLFGFFLFVHRGVARSKNAGRTTGRARESGGGAPAGSGVQTLNLTDSLPRKTHWICTNPRNTLWKSGVEMSTQSIA